MAYPISLNEVKQHLRIDPDNFDDDNYIETIIIPAAVENINLTIDPSSLMTDASCAASLKSSMLVFAGDMYNNRDSNELSSVKKNDTLQRLLMPHRKFYW